MMAPGEPSFMANATTVANGVIANGIAPSQRRPRIRLKVVLVNLNTRKPLRSRFQMFGDSGRCGLNP